MAIFLNHSTLSAFTQLHAVYIVIYSYRANIADFLVPNGFGTISILYLNILDEFVGQGHRSKVKVTRAKDVISRVF